jgi:hypothetical protein
MAMSGAGRRATPPQPDAVAALMQLVQAEYVEMPGLSVTFMQAQRLWGADAPSCREVFDALLERGFLTLTKKGRYVRR